MDPGTIFSEVTEFAAISLSPTAAACIFVEDCFRMYTMFFKEMGWQYDILNSSEGSVKGYKEISMEIINPFAAGIDVGSRSHWVAVGQREQDVQEFGVFNQDLFEMAL